MQIIHYLRVPDAASHQDLLEIRKTRRIHELNGFPVSQKYAQNTTFNQAEKEMQAHISYDD